MDYIGKHPATIWRKTRHFPLDFSTLDPGVIVTYAMPTKPPASTPPKAEEPVGEMRVFGMTALTFFFRIWR